MCTSCLSDGDACECECQYCRSLVRECGCVCSGCSNTMSMCECECVDCGDHVRNCVCTCSICNSPRVYSDCTCSCVKCLEDWKSGSRLVTKHGHSTILCESCASDSACSYCGADTGDGFNMYRNYCIHCYMCKYGGGCKCGYPYRGESNPDRECGSRL